MQLTDPTTFEKWLQPHTIEWYKQLSTIQHKYIYPWNFTITEPNGESIFDHEVTRIIADKKVLDVGCGHGEFTNKNGLIAKEIVGFDVTDHFIQIGLENKKTNVSFVLGNTKEGLPFAKDEFDCAYIRKGPPSAYLTLHNVVKSGGSIIGLHPGDDTHNELPNLFPNLFEISKGTTILDSLQQRLMHSHFDHFEIEVLNNTEFLHSPLDVLKLRTFGQHPFIYETLKERDLAEITRIYERHTTANGLATTFSRYIIRITV